MKTLPPDQRKVCSKYVFAKLIPIRLASLRIYAAKFPLQTNKSGIVSLMMLTGFQFLSCACFNLMSVDRPQLLYHLAYEPVL